MSKHFQASMHERQGKGVLSLWWSRRLVMSENHPELVQQRVEARSMQSRWGAGAAWDNKEEAEKVPVTTQVKNGVSHKFLQRSI